MKPRFHEKGNRSLKSSNISVPEGYKAPKRHFVNIRRDAYDHVYGPGGLTMKPDSTPFIDEMYERNADYYMRRVEAAEDAGEFLEGIIEVEIKNARGIRKADSTFTYSYVDGEGSIRRVRRHGVGWNDTTSMEAAAILDVLENTPEIGRFYMNARENGIDAGPRFESNSGTLWTPEIASGSTVREIEEALANLGIEMTLQFGEMDYCAYRLQRIAPLPSASRKSFLKRRRR